MQKSPEQRDAESRRNSVLALTKLCQVIGIAPLAPQQQTPPATTTDNSSNNNDNSASATTTAPVPTGLSRDNIHIVFHALLDSAVDYSVDNRGDVGSWVRISVFFGVSALLSPPPLPLFPSLSHLPFFLPFFVFFFVLPGIRFGKLQLLVWKNSFTSCVTTTTRPAHLPHRSQILMWMFSLKIFV